jgi:hypothetical protein
MAAPRFPQPFVERLKLVDPDWVLGGASRLPPNSISLLRDNSRFVEAALVGANHEMARELLWRGYPTDQMGTCFARFWPTLSKPPAAGPPDDVGELARWGDHLGANPGAGGGRTIVVLRGELLRRYPTTIVTAVFGETKDADPDPIFVPDPAVPEVEQLFRGTLPPDITYVGLAIAPDVIRQVDPANPDRGWFVVLTQPVEEPRFGLDEELPGSEGQGQADDVSDLSWQQFAAAGLITRGHLDPGRAGPLDWGPAGDAGTVATLLLQLPFQLLLKAADYLPRDA